MSWNPTPEQRARYSARNRARYDSKRPVPGVRGRHGPAPKWTPEEKSIREHDRSLRRRDTRRKLIIDLKNKPCLDCGKSYPSCCMDFDHRDPSQKKFNVGCMNYGSTRKLLAEAAKCDVVCANCHRIRECQRYRHERKSTNPETIRQYKAKDSKKQRIVDAKKKPCMDCGVEHPQWAMEFDHREPSEKKFTIAHGFYGVGMRRLEAEIAKCDVVCVNCHRVRTWITRA